MLILLSLCLALICAGAVYGLKAGQAGMGKFYIVGMGTAPDLITIRGTEAIERADIILVGNEQERERWKAFIGNREVWYCPDWIRLLYGTEPWTLQDPQQRALSERGALARQELVDRICSAVERGKNVAFLQAGDPMMHGLTLLLEILPEGIPTEIVPGVGAFQAASAALKMSPPYGYDTNAVILTMADWPGRADVNEKLMTTGSTMVFYTMLLDYPKVFAQLQRHFPRDTPVAVVINAGDPTKQRIIESTIGRFLGEVDYPGLPVESHILFVGKFLEVGQVRKDFVPQTGGEHA